MAGCAQYAAEASTGFTGTQGLRSAADAGWRLQNVPMPFRDSQTQCIGGGHRRLLQRSISLTQVNIIVFLLPAEVGRVNLPGQSVNFVLH
jgi:hypothetical protein